MNKYFKHLFCAFSDLIGQNKAESKVNTLKVYLIMLDQGRTEKVKGGRISIRMISFCEILNKK